MKREQIIAKCKVPQDVSGSRTARPQYSIKTKKKFAKYVVKHNLSVKEARVASRYKLSETQVKSWVQDYRDGRYDLSHSVSVTRS